MNKTVVELDLVGYSTICANFEQGLDVNSVAQLNGQIQSFVDAGLAAVNAVRREHVMQTTGDGAIVVFDSGSEAHKFAQAVNDATRAHNRSRQQHLAKRVFRMGAASGDIVMQETGSGYEIAGMTIARAVRLEAKAQPGAILVDQPTFEALSEEQQQRYASKETIAGKRDEQFEAYACQLNPDGPKDSSYFISRNDALKSVLSSVPESRAGSNNADISRIVKYAPAELIGRENELKVLSDAWQQAVKGETKRPHIFTFVALGGEGKTSLVAKWAAELAYQGWPGCEAAFAWSFYSQGTSEKTQASSDSFLKEGLLFFGDVEMANSAAGSFDKGRKLAQLIGERQALLILDGLEPLQYAPTSPPGSELKDQGVAALLKALAAKNYGLCVITTRYSIPDLRNFWQTTAPQIKLKSLSTEAGVALLRRLDIKGRQHEFEQLVRDVKGHALTLNLLGSFLRDAHAGDIRKRDLVKLEEADAEEQSGHAFHVMHAYVQSLKQEGEKGERALSILKLLGVFDRPATADCLNALWSGEEIAGLTGPLIGLSEVQRNITLKRLEDAQLITVNHNNVSGLVSVDAHPLVREYFAEHVQNFQADAWRAAHRRLYDHLCQATSDKKPSPSLEDLEPLYQAVSHGCLGALHQKTYKSVFQGRIRRADENLSWRKLGAFASDLGAVAYFFDRPWSRPSTRLTEADQAELLNEAGFCLWALGRLNEALTTTQAALERCIKLGIWDEAAKYASNLSELESTLGNLTKALQWAERSVSYADLSKDPRQIVVTRATWAGKLHKVGKEDLALQKFREAETLQRTFNPHLPLLNVFVGFQYCGLLLAKPERIAWQQMYKPERAMRRSELVKLCRSVSQRAFKTITVAQRHNWLLHIALDNLTLGRAALYETIIHGGDRGFQKQQLSHIPESLQGLRHAGTMDDIPRGLLTFAWLNCLRQETNLSLENLDEAWEIAERGPMRLHMADIHLYRARLFHAVKPYPWNKFADGRDGRGPKDDLADARKLIEQCGYWRRKGELEDAEEAAKGWM